MPDHRSNAGNSNRPTPPDRPPPPPPPPRPKPKPKPRWKKRNAMLRLLKRKFKRHIRAGSKAKEARKSPQAKLRIRIDETKASGLKSLFNRLRGK